MVRIPTQKPNNINFNAVWNELKPILDLNVRCMHYLKPNVYTKFKSTSKVNSNLNSVYAIVCEDCTITSNATHPYPSYIGHTSRNIKDRLKSHLNHEPNSPVGLHVANTNHRKPLTISLINVADVDLRVFYEATLISIF